MASSGCPQTTTYSDQTDKNIMGEGEQELSLRGALLPVVQSAYKLQENGERAAVWEAQRALALEGTVWVARWGSLAPADTQCDTTRDCPCGPSADPHWPALAKSHLLPRRELLVPPRTPTANLFEQHWTRPWTDVSEQAEVSYSQPKLAGKQSD